MNIAMCTGITYPSKMANRVHVLSMTKAFADAEHEVTLFGKKIQGFTYDRVDVVNVEFKSFVSAFLQLKEVKKRKSELLYVRDPILWSFLVLYNNIFFFLKIPIIYEVHDTPNNFFEKISLKLFSTHTKKIIAITQGLKDDLVKKFGVDERKIEVIPDGVDVEMFQNVDEREVEALYDKHNIPKGKKNVVYSGHLYEWKGVDTLAETAKLLPEYNFIFVGGWENEVKKFTEKHADIKNVYILGHVPHEEVPKYLQLADILVLPNSKKEKISEKYTSPLKMFEYMASKKPIVASDLPSIREILNKENAFLVEPNNPEALVEKINKAFSDNTQEKVEIAYKTVKQYSWGERSNKVLV